MGEGMEVSSVAHGRKRESLRRAFGAIHVHLDDPQIVEIMLNPDGQLWVEALGGEMEARGRVDPIRARQIIATVAALLDTVVTADHPILECELPLDGSRFEALVPPLVVAPSFTIRKKASMIFTLDQYVAAGILSPDYAAVIRTAVGERKNLLISGGTGTGKTTLANAVLHEVAQRTGAHRIVIIEDTRELRCAAPNAVFLRTSEQVDMTRLLRATLRLRPDRIVVGEVRGAEALALLKAWNTGHPGGVGTVHANDAPAALVRLEQLIQESGVPAIPALIAEAVDYVVSIKRSGRTRVVDEIVRVDGYRAGEGYRLTAIPGEATPSIVQPT
ncbi:MAG: P-type conjugative transfer ATPase TrbB [Acidiferrobacterales bacterium]